MHERNKWNTLLLSLIITLTAVWVIGCQSGCSSSDIPITASSEKPSINIQDTQLHGTHKKFIVDVEMDKDNQPTTLEGYKLQIAFIEQKTDGANTPPPQIEYQADGNLKCGSKVEEVLATFSNNTMLDDKKAILHLPFSLKLSEHATELKLAVKLLDNQSNTVQAKVVNWIADPSTPLYPNSNKPAGEQQQKIKEAPQETKQEGAKQQVKENVSTKDKEPLPTQQEEKKLLTLHHLQASIKPGSSPTKYKIAVEAQGDKISQETLNSIKLGYVIQDTNNPSGVRIKRGNIEDLQGAGLGNVLHIGLEPGQAKEFEVVLVPGEADHVSVLFFLEKEGQKKDIGPSSWTKHAKKKGLIKQEKDEKNVGCWKGIKATIEPDHTSPKKFTIILETPAETVSMNDIKLTYRLTGKGDLASARVKRGKVADVNQVPLSRFFKSTLKQGNTQKAQFVLDTGKAAGVRIQFKLEKNGEGISIGDYAWGEKE